MVLFKCKCQIYDPILTILEAVDVTNVNVSEHLSCYKEKRFKKGKGFLKDEQLFIVHNKSLPVEYNFETLIGLKIRKIWVVNKVDEHIPAIELLIGDKKLIFFESDLEEVNHE